MVIVVDDFLDKDVFEELSSVICSDNFPVFYQPHITMKEKDEVDHLVFTHTTYRNGSPQSEFFEWIFTYLLSQLDIKELIRSKVNCYPRTDKIVTHGWHKDFEFSHKSSLLCLNTCNGQTQFKTGEKVDSVKNRMILFDASQLHRSTSCTDQRCRWNIVTNFT